MRSPRVVCIFELKVAKLRGVIVARSFKGQHRCSYAPRRCIKRFKSYVKRVVVFVISCITKRSRRVKPSVNSYLIFDVLKIKTCLRRNQLSCRHRQSRAVCAARYRLDYQHTIVVKIHLPSRKNFHKLGQNVVDGCAYAHLNVIRQIFIFFGQWINVVSSYSAKLGYNAFKAFLRFVPHIGCRRAYLVANIAALIRLEIYVFCASYLALHIEWHLKVGRSRRANCISHTIALIPPLGISVYVNPCVLKEIIKIRSDCFIVVNKCFKHPVVRQRADSPHLIGNHKDIPIAFKNGFCQCLGVFCGSYFSLYLLGNTACKKVFAFVDGVSIIVPIHSTRVLLVGRCPLFEHRSERVKLSLPQSRQSAHQVKRVERNGVIGCREKADRLVNQTHTELVPHGLLWRLCIIVYADKNLYIAINPYLATNGNSKALNGVEKSRGVLVNRNRHRDRAASAQVAACVLAQRTTNTHAFNLIDHSIVEVQQLNSYPFAANGQFDSP